MNNEAGETTTPPSGGGGSVKRRGLLRLGTLASAITGAFALSGIADSRAQAAPPSGPSDKDLAATYVTKTALSDALAQKVAKGELVFNVKDYGAVGDGIADDTTAFETALSALTGTVFIPPGCYKITRTLYLDVEKLSLIGAGGATTLAVAPATAGFTGTTVLQVFSGDGTWANRRKRLRTVGGFNVVDSDLSRTLTALSMSGATGSSYEGHVETVIYKCMFIDGFNVAQEYGRHVYKTVTERLYTKSCNYAIKSASGQGDAGEVPVWRACMFSDDSGRFQFAYGAYFQHCSFHLTPGSRTHAFRVESTAVVVISNCHFEDISMDTGSAFKNPWFYVGQSATLTIRDSFAVVSGTGWSCFHSCVIENAGHVYIDSPGFEHLYIRVRYDEATTRATKGGRRPSFVDDGTTGFSRIRGMSSKPIQSQERLDLMGSKPPVGDYIFASMSATQAARLFKKYPSTPTSIDDLSALAGHTLTYDVSADALAIHGTNALKITSTVGGATGFFRLGSLLQIPAGATIASLQARYWKVGGTHVGIANRSYIFFDAFGNMIPDADVLAYNNAVTLNSLVTANNTPASVDFYSTYRRIPPNATHAFISLEVNHPTNSSMVIAFDYFTPQFV